MLNIKTEMILTFPDAVAFLPSHPHTNTLHRWRTKGVKGVKLESAKIGGARVTSVEALARFAEKLSGAPIRAEAAT